MLDSISTSVLSWMLVALIFLSAFFSSSETSMLALNKYRLKHLTKKKHRAAIRATALLKRPDRLIGVILIGNNLANISATVIATIITTRLFGEWATVVLMPMALTFIMLIFAEVTPKSVAAVFPEKIAFPASLILRPLLLVLYPVVWSVNFLSNSLAKVFGLDVVNSKLTDNLHPEELRTVVDEACDSMPKHRQGILLNVLDLEKATVEDILVPRNEVEGIDLEDNIDTIMANISTAKYTRLPVFEGDLNKIVGVLHLRNVAKFAYGNKSDITHDAIRAQLSDPYFIPESTPLPTQLINFQQEKQRTAVVVDEYGDIQGLATLVDLLEEIVGDFVSDTSEQQVQDIVVYKENCYMIDASVSVRDINRNLGWTLPTDGPKTLNGIIVEFLESIPDATVSFRLDDYIFEIKEIGENRIDKALVMRTPTTE